LLGINKCIVLSLESNWEQSESLKIKNYDEKAHSNSIIVPFDGSAGI
jgi:hypothetical protein